jgi:alpha-beta hydrolase superfamily lysophospholipase
MLGGMTTGWDADILGPPFEQRTLDLGTDDEGPVVATIVRARPSLVRELTGPLSGVDVLSVHGWSDYFFHTAVARFWTGLGARFHALDLRKYGRSLRAGQTPGDIDTLTAYDADIGAALDAIGPGRRLILQGHSTGGLILALWADRHRGAADAVILNAPWLELQVGALGRQAIAPLVSAAARLDPRRPQPDVDLGFYTRAQREIGAIPTPGYRADWRPERGFTTRPGWMRAILAGHATVASGLRIDCPVLVVLSARSASPFSWTSETTSADSVLWVDDIARAALRLGEVVTVGRIEGAIHDVFLSSPPARDRAFTIVDAWIRGALSARRSR